MNRRGKEQVRLPQAGTVYSFELSDGRFGACKVLRRVEERFGYAEVVLVELTSFIGSCPPRIDEPEVRKSQRLTHHSWNGQIERCWIGTTAPPNFQLVGLLSPTLRDRRASSTFHSGWLGFPLQRLTQWRWEHDREALLLEEDRQRAELQGSVAVPSRQLAAIAKSSFFESWAGDVPAEIIVASEKILRSAAAALVTSSAEGREPASLIGVLQEATRRFNELDERAQFITTIEREDICESLAELAESVGLKSASEIVDDLRDW